MTRINLAGSEEQLCVQLSNYMRLHWPEVLFHFDYGAGLKMTMGQAVRQKRLNRRAWPDMFVAEPHFKWSGLFIEVKKEGTRVFKRDGMPASDHIAEQQETLKQLNRAGYAAVFGVGFEECQRIIDSYLLSDQQRGTK